MPAPGGCCCSCGRPLKWTLDKKGSMWVHCPQCPDLFGIELAGERREGREAEGEDGLPF